MKPVMLPPGRARLATKPAHLGIGNEREYDRNIRRFALKRSGHRRGMSEDNVGLEGDQFLCERHDDAEVRVAIRSRGAMDGGHARTGVLCLFGQLSD